MIIILGLFMFGSATLYSTVEENKPQPKVHKTWKCTRVKGKLDCRRV